jgi:hypothetical protein
MEAYLRKCLPFHIATDLTPVITEILQVYTDYMKSVMWNFQQVENHMTSRNPAFITNFMSKFLGMYFITKCIRLGSLHLKHNYFIIFIAEPHQLGYMQAIFKFLTTGSTSDTWMERVGNEMNFKVKQM